MIARVLTLPYQQIIKINAKIYCIMKTLTEEYDSLMIEYEGCKQCQWYITAHVFPHEAFQITGSVPCVASM